MFNPPYKDGRGGISEGGFAGRIRDTSNKGQVKAAEKSVDLCLCTNASKDNNWDEYLSMMAPLSQLVLLILSEVPISFMGSHLKNRDIVIIESHLGNEADIGN
ncbi:hypothetical protein BGZ51_000265 [Haplosporangium sp. Z 767]|nr:hypothetical protein BGZ51_000265 [Haplosporangium sp. Z 767]